MRLLCFSDVHGNSYALRALIDMLPRLHYDSVFFLGDLFGYYHRQEECVNLLNDIPELICLKGNHDDMALKVVSGKLSVEDLVKKYGNCYRKISNVALKKVRHLVPQFELVSDGLRIGLFHGLPGDPLNGRLYPRDDIPKDDSRFSKYDVVIGGHTHFRMIRHIGKTLVVNAGSLGQPRDRLPACCLIFDTATKRAEYVDVKYPMACLLEDVCQWDPGNDKIEELVKRSMR